MPKYVNITNDPITVKIGDWEETFLPGEHLSTYFWVDDSRLQMLSEKPLPEDYYVDKKPQSTYLGLSATVDTKDGKITYVEMKEEKELKTYLTENVSISTELDKALATKVADLAEKVSTSIDAKAKENE